MKQANEPAFPEPFINDPDYALSIKPGLTKREYFAAMAMQAIISASHDSNVAGAFYEEDSVARNAIKMADELLKQLEL